MNSQPSSAAKIGVTLLRAGADAREIELPEGATLADLLREVHADTGDQAIFIDDRPLEEWLILQPGVAVSLVPRTRDAGRPGDWRETIGMFQNDPAFEEMMKAVQVEREAEREEP